MKNFIILFFVLSSTLTFACGDFSKKPAYLSAQKVECGRLFDTITSPTMTVNGKTYPFALKLSDMAGGCPSDDQSCYPPYLNIVHRGNAICKAFGFGAYATSNDWGIWKDLPDVMVSLERTKSGSWGPKVVSINHSRSEFAYTKTISCYHNYRKR
ncbi:MAG: hypothetical protein ACJ76H_09975 [Bacteriovoracaceae bacterium]